MPRKSLNHRTDAMPRLAFTPKALVCTGEMLRSAALISHTCDFAARVDKAEGGRPSAGEREYPGLARLQPHVWLQLVVHIVVGLPPGTPVIARLVEEETKRRTAVGSTSLCAGALVVLEEAVMRCQVLQSIHPWHQKIVSLKGMRLDRQA